MHPPNRADQVPQPASIAQWRGNTVRSQSVAPRIPPISQSNYMPSLAYTPSRKAEDDSLLSSQASHTTQTERKGREAGQRAPGLGLDLGAWSGGSSTTRVTDSYRPPAAQPKTAAEIYQASREPKVGAAQCLSAIQGEQLPFSSSYSCSTQADTFNQIQWTESCPCKRITRISVIWSTRFTPCSRRFRPA
jgi:hypothetical protein